MGGDDRNTAANLSEFIKYLHYIGWQRGVYWLTKRLEGYVPLRVHILQNVSLAQAELPAANIMLLSNCDGSAFVQTDFLLIALLERLIHYRKCFPLKPVKDKANNRINFTPALCGYPAEGSYENKFPLNSIL